MSLVTARTVAQNWYSIVYEVVNPIVSSSFIETERGIDTCYIFNFRSGGFIITSSSNDAKPILAYNDTGDINSDRSPEFEWLINCYKIQIYDIIEENIISNENRIIWQQLYDNSYVSNRDEVLLEMGSSWSQGEPYNNFTPMINGEHCVAGCGPIAMAQIINYYKHLSDYHFSNEIYEPNYITLSQSINIDEDSSEFQFPNFESLDLYMSSIRNEFDLGNSIDFIDGFAALSFACGIALYADYNQVSTGTFPIYTTAFAKNFGYRSNYIYRQYYSDIVWLDMMMDEIIDGRLILYGGTDETAGGHAFVLHGFTTDIAHGETHFKVNWGWGENELDGWYTLETLNPNNYSFIENQRAGIEIEPVPLTLIGKIYDALPVFEIYGNNDPHPHGLIEIECENLTYGGSSTITYDVADNGFYLIQPDGEIVVGTEYQITFTSEIYETESFVIEIIDESDVFFIDPIEIFWKFKPLYNGWNWESFPILDRIANDPVDAIPILEEIEDFNNGITEISLQNDLYGILNYDEVGLWNPITGYELQSTRCYKIKILPELANFWDFRELYIEGSELYPVLGVDLIAGQDNWIGYWVKKSQDIDDAFGQDWDKITSIKAEDWIWKNMTPTRELDDSVPIYYPIKPLHYGKGYVVRVNEDILGFQWNFTDDRASKYIKKVPEDFSFDEKADYEVIIIDSIGGGNNVSEIGVFENDICVGASVVDSLPVHILAYTDEMNRGSNLSFQVTYGERRDLSNCEYSVLNLETGRYESKPLIIGEQDHNIVKINLENTDQDLPNIGKIKLLPNFPNPFNPLTKISFLVYNNSKVSLEIYNIKGQLLKELLNEYVETGDHQILWDGTNDKNEQVASGVYFYKLSTERDSQVRKMVLIK
ncbi:MAG: hypothetical protein APR54_01890 [Candidatus Cloacimonas sp. SDB]|nr:MAG: hypothetical protein APR54_01890 [Candidatus Cloacimonas sp. SDB]